MGKYLIAMAAALAMVAASGAVRAASATCRDCAIILDEHGNPMGEGCVNAVGGGMTGCEVSCPPGQECTCSLYGDPCSGFAMLEVDAAGELKWVVAGEVPALGVALASIGIECNAGAPSRIMTAGANPRAGEEIAVPPTALRPLTGRS